MSEHASHAGSMTPNPQLLQRIKDLPATLDRLEQDQHIHQLLSTIDHAKTKLESTRPWDGVEESAIDDYRHDWLSRYVYNSNAIEGSTLTLLDTELVLEGEFVPSDGPARDIFAAKGVADGMDYAHRWAQEHTPLNVDLVKRLHEVTALDVQPVMRGQFRPYGYIARITATTVKTADPLEIYEDVEALIESFRSSMAHPILKAAGFHTFFENIHPFADGNGRTGRQLLNLMLLEAGYPPVAIKHDAGRNYGHSLEQWQIDDNAHPFLEILASSIQDEQNAMATIITNLRNHR